MKRIYHHYEKWEDYQTGMFAIIKNQDEQMLISKAQMILSDDIKTREAMNMVINQWPVACEVNLSHRGLNRQAWLGQSACWLAGKVQCDQTKLAWHRLTADEQMIANAVADEVIKIWENRQKDIDKLRL
jgi:hypothetical protein